MAAPVLKAPNSRLFGREIVGRHPDPFVVIDQFEHPRPLGLYTQPATDYVGAVVAAVTGNGVSAYNAVVLATFPLAALFAYLLAFELTRSRPASWLAGLLYAFAPFHLAQAAYHPHGAQTQWLPLYLLALWRCLEQASARRLLLLGGAVVLVASSNFYYGLMAGVLTPVAVLGFWLVQRRAGEGAPAGLRSTVLALAALAAAGLGYIRVFAPAVFTAPQRLAFPRADLDLYGAAWSSYLVPPIGHPLLGPWVNHLWERLGGRDVLEQQVSVGLGLSLLSLVAIGLYLRGERDRELAATPALVLLGAVAFVVSLAPAENPGVGILEGLLRPSATLYDILPMFRAYARFGIMVFLPVAILAGAGALRLLRHDRKLARALGAGLLALLLVELVPFPPFRWRDVMPTSAHRFLEGVKGPVQVLDCASPNRFAERPTFYRFRHRISLRAGNVDCGDLDLPTKLAHEDYSHLLVRRESALGRWLGERAAPAGLRPIGEFEDALLFSIENPSPARIYLEFERGFHWREFLGDRSYRWMASTGALTITNPSTETARLELELELHAFPQARIVAIEIDGNPLIQLRVATEPGTYVLPVTSISPGRHTVDLLPESGAVVADSVLGNHDSRELSVALWGWKIRPGSP